MELDKLRAVYRMEILRLVFELMYDTLGNLRHDRRGGYHRLQAVSQKLAAALSRCGFSSDRSAAMAEVQRCAEQFRVEFGRLLAEEVCSDLQQREAEALVGLIERLAAEMREPECG